MIEDFNNYSTLMDESNPLNIRLIGETYCDRNFKISREKSDLTALEYVIDGTGTLEIEGQHFNPEKDDVFLLTEGSKHKYFADPAKPWHKYWIVFEGPLAETLVKCYIPEDTYYFKRCGAIKQYFAEIFDISKREYSYDVMVRKITIQLMNIFIYLRDTTQSETTDLAEIIKKLLDESVEQEYNLDRLCREVNYSKNYVINIFKKKYNVTPYKYFIERKIDVAKVYLTHSNTSVGNIAKLLHYADQQYFSTVFKSFEGMSPIEYRRMTRM